MYPIPDWQREIRFLGGNRDAEQALMDKYETEIRTVARTSGVDNGVIMRAQHAKMLAGFSSASFRIGSDVPEDLHVGFLKPDAKYKSEVRFSNAAGSVAASDAMPDLRGVAFRVLLGNDEQIDFLMTNANRHHARDAEEAMATIVAFAVNGPFRKLRGILRLARRVGISTAFRIVRTLKAQMSVPVESIATETFYSRAPLVIGSTVVKYRLRPTVSKSSHPRAEADLSSELLSRLKSGDVTFDFQVQLYVDKNLTPVEDATVEWEAPFITIATLTIPHESESDIRIERQAFNPWNVPSDDFTPIGSMNRARLRVYEASASLRAAGL